VDSQMPPRGKVDIWRQSGKMAAVKGLPTASSLAGDLDANLARGSSVFKSPRKKGRFGKGYTAQGSRRRKSRRKQKKNRDVSHELLMKGSFVGWNPTGCGTEAYKQAGPLGGVAGVAAATPLALLAAVSGHGAGSTVHLGGRLGSRSCHSWT
jgi:hypothetical protein